MSDQETGAVPVFDFSSFHRVVAEFMSDRGGKRPAFMVVDRTTARGLIVTIRSLTLRAEEEKALSGPVIIAGIPIVVIPGPACMVAVGTPGEEILRP